MKRYIKNAFYLLSIVAIIFAATKFYSPQEAPIKGASGEERVDEIRDRIDKRYEYISVLSADISSNTQTGVFVKYVLVINIADIYLTQSSPDTVKSQEAITQYRESIVDILKLTMEFVVQNDPTIKNIVLVVIFPDGTEVQSPIPTAQLFSLLAENAEDIAWIEKFSINAIQLQITEPRTLNISEGGN